MDHLLMEERLAAAPVDHLTGAPAYHALTYGWLLSGLARAVTGKGMRELIRTRWHDRSTPTVCTWAVRPPVRRPKWRRSSRRRARGPIRCSTSSRRRWRACRSPARSGSMYFPGIKSFVQGDIPFLDGEVPAANGVVTGRGLAKMYAAIANGGDDRRQAVPVAGAGARAGGKPRVAARPEHGRADAVPSGLPRVPDPGMLRALATSGWAAPSAGAIRRPAAHSRSCTTAC